MATNPYFNNFGSAMEQQLIQDLVIESIRIFGIDVHYCPRVIENRDEIFSELEYNKFISQYMVEMYIRNVDGFAGDGEFLSKFGGIEVRDQITFTVAQRTFANEVGGYSAEIRPQEGDIIYVPMFTMAYQITYVDKKAIFYQLGQLSTWDLTCEVYEYSNDIFATGAPEIDNLFNNMSTDEVTAAAIMANSTQPLATSDGAILIQEEFVMEDIDEVAQNDEFEAGDDFLDFSEIDPFSEGGRF